MSDIERRLLGGTAPPSLCNQPGEYNAGERWWSKPGMTCGTIFRTTEFLIATFPFYHHRQGISRVPVSNSFHQIPDPLLTACSLKIRPSADQSDRRAQMQDRAFLRNFLQFRVEIPELVTSYQFGIAKADMVIIVIFVQEVRPWRWPLE